MKIKTLRDAAIWFHAEGETPKPIRIDTRLRAHGIAVISQKDKTVVDAFERWHRREGYTGINRWKDKAGVHNLRLTRIAEQEDFFTRAKRLLFGQKRRAVEDYLKFLKRPLPKRRGRRKPLEREFEP